MPHSRSVKPMDLSRVFSAQPGMSPRTDSWTARSRSGRGFHKAQAFGNKTDRSDRPSSARPQSATARSSTLRGPAMNGGDQMPGFTSRFSVRQEQNQNQQQQYQYTAPQQQQEQQQQYSPRGTARRPAPMQLDDYGNAIQEPASPPPEPRSPRSPANRVYVPSPTNAAASKRSFEAGWDTAEGPAAAATTTTTFRDSGRPKSARGGPPPSPMGETGGFRDADEFVAGPRQGTRYGTNTKPSQRPVSANPRLRSAAGGTRRYGGFRSSGGLADRVEVERPGTSNGAYGATQRATTEPVLRFSVYFVEEGPWERTSTGVPSMPGNCLRKFVLSYFVQDNTMSIRELAEENSGYATGSFFKRSVGEVPYGRGELGPEDFMVGSSFDFMGRTFFVSDADPSTRRWYQESPAAPQGFAQGPPSAPPRALGGQKYGAEHATGLGQARSAAGTASPRYAGDRHGTGANGRNPAAADDDYGDASWQARPHSRTSSGFKAHKEQMSKEAAYLNTTGAVLKFSAVWEDESSGGMKHWYRIVFYPGDGSIEIRTIPQPGFDTFPNLLRRSKLAKNWSKSLHHRQEPEFVTEEDLVCGEYLDVYSRKLQITTCDRYTTDYYTAKYGIAQQQVTRPGSAPPARQDAYGRPGAAKAPSTNFMAATDTGGAEARVHSDKAARTKPNKGGFDTSAPDEWFMTIGGDEDFGEGEGDGGGEGLVGDEYDPVNKKSAKSKTFAAVLRNQWKYLRVAMKLVTESEIDRSRSFTCKVHLEDDTLQIDEEHVKNSGIVGGKFLRRGRYKNMAPKDGGKQRAFRGADFMLGDRLSFANKHVFQVTRVDSNSFATCEQLCEDFPESDITLVLAKVRKVASRHDCDLRKLWAGYERSAARRSESKFPDGSQNQLDGYITRDSFLRGLRDAGVLKRLTPHERITTLRKFAERDATGHFNIGTSRINYGDCCDYIAYERGCALADAGRLACSFDSNAEVEEVMNALCVHEVPWRTTFRALDARGSGAVPMHALLDAMTKKEASLSSVHSAYVDKLYSDRDGDVRYHDLCDEIYSTAPADV